MQSSNLVQGFFEALRRHKLVKVLAEPTLLTVNGRPAFFNIGGEFPILVPDDSGSPTIEYKQYGTRLDCVPTILGNDKIRLEIRQRVSELDPTLTITIGSTEIPGLRILEIHTGLELKTGHTVIISGPVRSGRNVKDSDLLEQEKDAAKENSQILFLVSAEIVDAKPPKHVSGLLKLGQTRE